MLKGLYSKFVLHELLKLFSIIFAVPYSYQSFNPITGYKDFNPQIKISIFCNEAITTIQFLKLNKGYI